jgi:hypothetical protein
VSKIDDRQMSLRLDLARVTNHAPLRRPIPSCNVRMVGAVVEAVGPEAALSAQVFGELVDLAVADELARVGCSVSEIVLKLVRAFQADCIAIVVAAQLERRTRQTDAGSIQSNKSWRQGAA